LGVYRPFKKIAPCNILKEERSEATKKTTYPVKFFEIKNFIPVKNKGITNKNFYFKIHLNLTEVLQAIHLYLLKRVFIFLPKGAID